MVAHDRTSAMSLLPLLDDVRACTVCNGLPLGPRPLLQIAPGVRVLLIGQAPGRRAHESGIPWNDPSGDRLREWLGLSRAQFYDDPRLGLLPMAFCYPGTGKGGDFAPRPECQETWHERLLDHMPKIRTTLLLGKYAHARYLPDAPKSVTEAVRSWERTAPRFFPLPHPSPRNNRWLKANPWFEADTLPALRAEVKQAFAE